MTQFLEQFLNWVAVETLLSGLLFLSYYFLIRNFKNPLDRFNFLYISFGVILFLPWAPMPVISEPIFKNLISNAAIAFQGNLEFGQGNWFLRISPTLISSILPLIYFSILTVRWVRILSSYSSLKSMAHSGSVNTTLSEFPVILHDYPISPIALGWIRPKILISRNAYRSLSGSELNLVIQHEEEHIRRGDGLSNFLRIFVREILFFSPFIFKLAQKFEEEMELSVDAQVLAKNHSSTRAYGALLLKMVDLSQSTLESGAIGNFLSNSAIKRRLISMKQSPKDRAKILGGLALGGFMIVSTLGISLFGSQAYSSSDRLDVYLMDPTKGFQPKEKPILTESDFASGALMSDCEFEDISSPVLKSALPGQDLRISTALSSQEAQMLVNRIGRNLR